MCKEAYLILWEIKKCTKFDPHSQNIYMLFSMCKEAYLILWEIKKCTKFDPHSQKILESHVCV